MKKKTVVIIQARFGSSRLPGKVLADIGGQAMLSHVIRRVQRAKTVDEVVIATSQLEQDDVVARFCEAKGVLCFRGSEEDVLDRYYQAAKWRGAEVIVRVTGDCPLIDAEIVDKVVRAYFDGNHDYVTNTLRYSYPDGLDTEVFSFDALEKAWREAALPAEREHVTPYMRTSSAYRRYNVENEIDLSRQNLRWTVDEPQDLEFVRTVYARLGAGTNAQTPEFGFREVLQLLDAEPTLANSNQNLIRNEGFYKSIAEEAPVAVIRRGSLAKSRNLKDRAEKLIPSGTQTFSKGPTQFVQGVAPNFLKRGQGSHVWDVDNNEYIDYPLALGAIILGHSYPAVTRAVTEQMKDGTTFSLPHPLEVEVSEALADIIPCAEMVRFCKNGSDATAGAVRVARAYTSREMITCSGYHGWQDWFIGTTTRNKGVPQSTQKLTVPFEYNQVESLKKIFAAHPGKIAAVILEPVGLVEPKDDFLREVRKLASEEGALLIFDEIVTGFRFALGGAQEYFSVTPDLACFGKGMANGYPVSAVVGRKDIMRLFDEVFFSFTFGGETLSLAAALATLREIKEKNVIPHLWELGQKLRDGYNVLAKAFGVQAFTECVGYAPRTVMTFKDAKGQESLLRKSLFQQECLKRGVLFTGAQNICFSHNQADVDYTLRVYRTAMEILAQAIEADNVAEKLEGEPVQPVFRRP